VKEVTRWLDLIRFISLDSSFHFIHAADIAEIVAHLLLQPSTSSDLVLGNPPLTFNQAVEQSCRYYKKRIYVRIPFPVNIKMLRFLARIFRVRLSAWDDYCIQHRHFVYQTVNPTTFGLPSAFPTLESLLRSYA
jgi:nucleoside-diphosphate-sugar epimerase